MKLSSVSLLIAFFFTATLLHAEEDTPLEKQMQTLARGTKQLSAQVADPAKQQENIALIESLKKAAKNSEALEPRKTATIGSGERAAFLSAYKAQIQKLVDAYSHIEEAVKAGQYDKAQLLLSTLGPIKKEGHTKFKQD